MASPGWRFLVLDAYQDAVIGYPKDDPRYIKNARYLSDHNPNINANDPDASGDWLAGIPRGDKSRRFVPYNGGLGAEQLAWLRTELLDAARQHERVIVLSHVILHPKACDVSLSVSAWFT
jgi:manganese-dependent ADP-ribose/CDP-alcohol diphosphatase